MIRENLYDENTLKKLKSQMTNLSVPTENHVDFWITHISKIDYPYHSEFGGKWLIFSDEKNIDNIWLKIKKLQDEGMLGNISKVSTFYNAKQKEKYYKSKNKEKETTKKENINNYVICIYTYNSNDKEDLMRVRENLKKNGFESPLHYKRDIETIKGVYGTENEFLITV